MSKQQGLRRCASSTNMDTIRCSSYAPKLVPPPSRCSPLCSSRTPRQTSTAPRSKAVVSQKKVDKPEVIRKQINADEGALVEVRVRRPKPKGETSESGKWEELLKPNSRGTALSSFQNFDPLRTLHFLIQELHTRLQGQLPHDTSLLQIILDMQLALNRVPQETAANLQSLRFDEFANRQKYKNKPFVLNKGTQTRPTENYADIIEVNKQLESNITKLELSCKQMEGLCCQLKDEKDALEVRLLGESETVRFLQNKIRHLESSLNDKSSKSGKLAQLKKERDDLQAKLAKLRAELKTTTKSNQSEELYRLVQELQSQKQSAEHQCADLKHKLASLTIENEKYAATLSIRDRDLGEIRREMDQLQEMVNQQLVEMQRQSTLGSEVTSGSYPPTASDEQWYRDVLTKVSGDNFTLSSIHTSSSTANNQDAPTSDEKIPDFLKQFTH